MIKFKFERDIINPILNIIKEEQDYLCLPENLPQLAKLGYMYNFLWYVGRITYGYNGRILKRNDCEDNPKYKLEACEPKNDKQDNLIYDAWAMHVSNDGNITSFEEFKNILYKGTKLTDLEQKELKINKTFDDWVEIKLDSNYGYKSIYPNKRRVADHLLCCIGNGYGYKNGYVIEEAGGADQDKALYGDWMNAKFKENIQIIVNKIISYPEVETAINVSRDYIIKILKKRKAEENKWREDIIKKILKNKSTKKQKELLDEWDIIDAEVKKQMEERTRAEAEKYHSYYPLCEYSIITMLDENTHPSYLKEAAHIWKEIIEHEKEEPENNVKLAKEFINKPFIKMYL